MATSDYRDQDNMISSSSGHVTYTVNSLMPESVIDVFDIDRSTGSLVVARELDRELYSEYRLEVRALDTSAMNNPQSSAVTVRVDIADANDNAPKWSRDPLTIPLSEDTQIGTSVYNFTATDADADSNGDLRYSLVRQYPNLTTFSVDPLTGTLVLLAPLDYESLQEYTIVVKATDQSLNISERLSTTVTARILITDSNDNTPKFVVPSGSTVLFSDSVTVGMLITHLVAVDDDSGDNGRVTYVISGGNEENLFSLGYDTGVLTLAKPITVMENRVFAINVTASDHGTPTRHAHMTLKLSVQSSSENPPRFANSVYYASIAENAGIGTFVVKVTARSTHNDEGEFRIFFLVESCMVLFVAL